jgi:hypothetical protein
MKLNIDLFLYCWEFKGLVGIKVFLPTFDQKFFCKHLIYVGPYDVVYLLLHATIEQTKKYH